MGVGGVARVPGGGDVIEHKPPAAPRPYFFGCWNSLGHFLHAPGGRSDYAADREINRAALPHLDANYAPRQGVRGAVRGRLCWTGEGAEIADRRRIEDHSVESPQGEYLRHRRGGFTLIAWWDRCQGDTRPGCNSTFLLEGDHDEAAMLAALAEHFPHVLANLQRAGVVLRPAVP